MAATVVACASNEPDGFRSGASGAFVRSSCAFAIPQSIGARSVECGSMTVPLRHDRTVNASAYPADLSLALAVLRHTPQGTRSEHALVLLRGGPGWPILDDLPALLVRWAALLSLPLDILAFDFRGVGRSSKLAGCSLHIGDATMHTRQPDSLAPCYDSSTRQRTDLSSFTSEQAAADLEAIRRTLGYQRLLLYGESYGSLLAQTYMRDFPTAVERAVLDGAWPLGINRHTEGIAGTWQAMLRTLAACEKNAACGSRLPRLVERFQQTMASLQQGDRSFDHRDFWRWLDGWLDDASSARHAPFYVDTLLQAVAGEPAADAALLAAMRSDSSSFASSIAEGQMVHFAVDCSSYTYESFLESSGPYVEPWVGDASQPRRDFYRRACFALRSFGVRPGNLQPGRLAAPTLVLASPYDPTTPLSFARLFVERTPNAHLVVVPSLGHVTLGGHPCADSATLDFLAGMPNRQRCDEDELPRFVKPAQRLTHAAVAGILGGGVEQAATTGVGSDGSDRHLRRHAGKPTASRKQARRRQPPASTRQAEDHSCRQARR